MKPVILITEKIEGPGIEKLKKSFTVRMEPSLWQTPDKLKEVLPSCSALIIRNQTEISADLLAYAPNLKVIGRAGAGLNNIDIDAASKAGIVVTHTPDQNSISVAELTITFMLAQARMLTTANAHTHNGSWNRHLFVGEELYGKTLGIVGLGRIGFLTALRAQAFGMRIIAYDAFISSDNTFVTETRTKLVELKELLEQSDFVSSHMPLTPDTKHFFKYKQFTQMKPSAFFLNLSRGKVVDEQGLIKALQEKQIAGAALDVREEEPPGMDPLSNFENVILTPHIAAFTRDAQQRVVTAVCEDVNAVLHGKKALHFVNFSESKISVMEEESSS